MLNGQAGMSWAPSKGGIAAWNQGLQAKEADALVVGGPYASLEKGQTVHMGKINPEGNMSAAVSSTCKDPAGAVAFLDYMFSKEGRLLLNFGIEGESYTLENGQPVITDLILDSQDMPVLSKMNFYATSAEGNAGVATIVDQRYLEQINAVTPGISEALQLWADSSTFESEIPGIIPASKDSAQYASVMNEVTTYSDEMFLKFVTGQEDIDTKFDEYVKEIEKKGIAQAVEIMQNAYDTFAGR